jgi:WXG100 family type VII secretion target
MTKIRIDTEHAREVGRRLIAEGDHLAEIGYELQRAIGGLDTGSWDGRSRARAEPMLNRVRPESARVADEIDHLGRKLRHVAETFEQEDNTAARNLEGMGWVDWDTKKVSHSSGSVNKDNRFIDGPSLTDIKQGHLGNCYLIAAIGAIADTHPEIIRNAIHPNPDGTYTVTFYDNNGNPVEIKVTPDFPKSKAGKNFAQSTQDEELWVALTEKAYVKWKTGGTEAKHYEQVAGGDAGDAMRALTGEKIYTLNIRKSSAEGIGDNIRQALNEGNPVTVGIKPTIGQHLDNAADFLVRDEWVDRTRGNSQDLVGKHAYVVKSIKGNQVTLYNPWGKGPQNRSAEFTVSLDDLKKHASDIDMCDIEQPSTTSYLA